MRRQTEHGLRSRLPVACVCVAMVLAAVPVNAQHDREDQADQGPAGAIAPVSFLGDENLDLVRRFAPVLVFDAEPQGFPMSAQVWFDDMLCGKDGGPDSVCFDSIGIDGEAQGGGVLTIEIGMLRLSVETRAMQSKLSVATDIAAQINEPEHQELRDRGVKAVVEDDMDRVRVVVTPPMTITTLSGTDPGVALQLDQCDPQTLEGAQKIFDLCDTGQDIPYQPTSFDDLANVPTYYHVVECGSSQLRIRYWWYYGHQPICTSGDAEITIDGLFEDIPINFFPEKGEHIADWEHVDVILSDDRSQVAAVTFFQHGGWYTRIANPGEPVYPRDPGFEIDKDGRPIVYVGRAAHGAYHDSHETVLNACLYHDDRRRPGDRWVTGNSPLIDLTDPEGAGDERGWLEANKTAKWDWGFHKNINGKAYGGSVGTHITQSDRLIGCDATMCKGLGAINVGPVCFIEGISTGRPCFLDFDRDACESLGGTCEDRRICFIEDFPVRECNHPSESALCEESGGTCRATPIPIFQEFDDAACWESDCPTGYCGGLDVFTPRLSAELCVYLPWPEDDWYCLDFIDVFQAVADALFNDVLGLVNDFLLEIPVFGDALGSVEDFGEAGLTTLFRFVTPRIACGTPLVVRESASATADVPILGEVGLSGNVEAGVCAPVAFKDAFDIPTNDGGILVDEVPNVAPVALARVSTEPLECRGEHTATGLDGGPSYDNDGDSLTYTWRGGFPEGGGVVHGVTPTVTLPLGTTEITLVVNDGALDSEPDLIRITVVDREPPVLDCPQVAPQECSSHVGTPIGLTAAATDVCSATVRIDNDSTPNGDDASATYPLGTTIVEFTATDPSGNIAACSVPVTVKDETRPMLTVATDQTILWPPNHRLVPVHPGWTATDICDANPRVVLASAESSEPDDAPGGGDGHTTGDIAGAEIGSPDREVGIRAERSGSGPGRTYSLGYMATDGSGNFTHASTAVTVPHDGGSRTEPLVMRLDRNGDAGLSRIEWPAVSGAVGYDVISGDLSQIRVENGQIDLGTVNVLARGTTGTSLSEAPGALTPASGTATFYLIQSRTEHGGVGFGTESAPLAREPRSCIGGCPDDIAF